MYKTSKLLFWSLVLGVGAGMLLAPIGMKNVKNTNSVNETDVLSLEMPTEDTVAVNALEDGEGFPYDEETGEFDTTNGLSKEVLRFHIRANSDSKEDQRLKMEVKGYAMEILKPILKEADSVESAKRMIEGKMPYLKAQLEAYMLEQGFSYEADVYMTEEYFPLKEYGDATFPEGKYQALRIDIGERAGQNWWCVLYPTLCFTDATHAVLPMEEKKKLRDVLTESEYENVMESGQKEEEWRFKLWDDVKEFFFSEKFN